MRGDNEKKWMHEMRILFVRMRQTVVTMRIIRATRLPPNSQGHCSVCATTTSATATMIMITPSSPLFSQTKNLPSPSGVSESNNLNPRGAQTLDIP
mmetsp:Transcript_3212/g.12276  ORF Transcript_3212/g.12276 Transcript_3212/m.12276 type:complete len:96 (-) Transcript_3212:750-1037(-)